MELILFSLFIMMDAADALKFFLPEGVLGCFDVKNVEKKKEGVEMMFEEKNVVPEIPKEHRGKRLTSKGFKKIVVNDFPIRGKKSKLIFLRRVWKIEGVDELLKRKIEICAPGTKLEKEFASFLKIFD